MASVREINEKLNEIDQALYSINLNISNAEKDDYNEQADVSLENLKDYKRLISEYRDHLESLKVPAYKTNRFYMRTVYIDQ